VYQTTVNLFVTSTATKLKDGYDAERDKGWTPWWDDRETRSSPDTRL